MSRVVLTIIMSIDQYCSSDSVSMTSCVMIFIAAAAAVVGDNVW